MMAKAAVAAKTRRESRCHLHRKSFSPPRTRRSSFLILDKTQFHSIPRGVWGQLRLLEAALGTCCLFVFRMHKPLACLVNPCTIVALKKAKCKQCIKALCLEKKNKQLNIYQKMLGHQQYCRSGSKSWVLYVSHNNQTLKYCFPVSSCSPSPFFVSFLRDISAEKATPLMYI